MRDASVVLLVLIGVYVLIDYGYSRWRAFAPTPELARFTVVSLLQGMAVGCVLFAFGGNGTAPGLAGLGFALAWGTSRWLVGKWGSGFAFVLQFFLQVLALGVIWLSVEGYWTWAVQASKGLITAHHMLVLLAYIMVLRPASALTGAFLTPWLASVNTEGSLKRAGTLIGYLERLLILTFVLLEQWEAIGFLLTAKSILRFNDIKGAEQRSLSEYVLLGTLISFTISIAVGLAVLKISDAL